MEGGGEHAGAKPELSVQAPASRSGSSGATFDPLATTRPTEAARRTEALATKLQSPKTYACFSPPCFSHHHARNDSWTEAVSPALPD